MKLSWRTRFVFSIAAAAFAASCHQACLAEEPAAQAESARIAEYEKAFLGSDELLVRVWLGDGLESFIGARTVPAEEVLRVQLGLAEGQGLAITNVDSDGAAAKAGIQVNDVLIAIADKDITDVETFHKQLQESADKPVKIRYIRSGNRRVTEVTPKLSHSAAALFAEQAAGEPTRFRLGVNLAGADATLRSQLSIADSEGLVVTGVEPDSPAMKAGVMVNDVLLKLDGKALKTIEELSARLQEIGDKSVTLELLRRGKPATLSITPQKLPQGNVSFHVHSRPALESFFFTIPDKGDHVRRRIATDQAAIVDSAIRFAATQGQNSANESLPNQLSRLMEQSRQLQASLEALNAAIQKEAASKDKPEPTPAKPFNHGVGAEK